LVSFKPRKGLTSKGGEEFTETVSRGDDYKIQEKS